MTALQRDLVVEQGSTWSRAWRFTVGGQPFVDSTWTVRAQVRPTAASADVLHEWTSSGSAANATVDDQGTIILTLDPATSSAWPWTRGVYDLEASKAGVTHRLVEGSVRITREVTR